MGKKEEKKVYIYESPDGGDTIYRRELVDGKASGVRVVVKGNNTVYEILKQYDEKETEDTSELEELRQKVLNLEMANAELKDMLRNMNVAI